MKLNIEIINSVQKCYSLENFHAKLEEEFNITRRKQSHKGALE